MRDLSEDVMAKLNSIQEADFEQPKKITPRPLPSRRRMKKLPNKHITLIITCECAMKKYKAIAIPVSFADGKPTVSHGYGIIEIQGVDICHREGVGEGGKYLNPIRCALTGTRGRDAWRVISLKNGEYTEFKFIHKESPNSRSRV
jgi:hypothetical protein